MVKEQLPARKEGIVPDVHAERTLFSYVREQAGVKAEQTRAENTTVHLLEKSGRALPAKPHKRLAAV